jgi:hypothetical protein
VLTNSAGCCLCRGHISNRFEWCKPEPRVAYTVQLSTAEVLIADPICNYMFCGINTMFNTGTVVGVSANIFGAAFPDKFVPSFTWGGTADSAKFLLEKATSLAKIVMQRRGIQMTSVDSNILTEVFLKEANPISD